MADSWLWPPVFCRARFATAFSFGLAFGFFDGFGAAGGGFDAPLAKSVRGKVSATPKAEGLRCHALTPFK
jgi:hypothetical protein